MLPYDVAEKRFARFPLQTIRPPFLLIYPSDRKIIHALELVTHNAAEDVAQFWEGIDDEEALGRDEA